MSEPCGNIHNDPAWAWRGVYGQKRDDRWDMKPDWKNAPEWANYLAMDENNGWWWYADKPIIEKHRWINYETKHCERAAIKDWQETLERRPHDR